MKVDVTIILKSKKQFELDDSLNGNDIDLSNAIYDLVYGKYREEIEKNAEIDDFKYEIYEKWR